MRRTQVGADGGRTAAVRSAHPADLPALGEFFAGLSARTRYLRFFASVTPGAAMLGLLSGGSATADALIAIRDGAIVGHAMAVDRGQPGGSSPLIADIGVVVADAWQGRGVGSALTRALAARALARGVTSATMDVLPGNHQVLAMIIGHWPAARITRSADYTTVCCPLAPSPIPPNEPGNRRPDAPVIVSRLLTTA